MPGVRVANTAVIEDSNHEQGLFALLRNCNDTPALLIIEFLIKYFMKTGGIAYARSYCYKRAYYDV